MPAQASAHTVLVLASTVRLGSAPTTATRTDAGQRRRVTELIDFVAAVDSRKLRTPLPADARSDGPAVPTQRSASPGSWCRHPADRLACSGSPQPLPDSPPDCSRSVVRDKSNSSAILTR